MAVADLPAPDKPVSHRTQAFWFFWAARAGLSMASWWQGQVGAAPQAEVDHAGAYRVVAVPVDEDETTRLPELPVGVEGDLPVEADVAIGDVVELECLGRGVLQIGDVELVLDARYLDLCQPRADLQQIRTLGQQWLLVHPHHVAGELVAEARRVGGGSDDVAAAHVDLVREGEGHGLAGPGAVEVSIRADDAVYRRGPVRGADQHGVAGAHEAGGYRAREAAELGVGAVHPLDRHAKGRALAVGGDVGRFEGLEQRRPVVPIHGGGRLGDVVAGQSRYGNAGDAGHIEPLRKVAVGLDDPVVDVFGPVHEVHLVDGQDHMAHSQQGQDGGVPAGLRQHPLAGVDEHHREIGGGCAGDHVPCVLLMSRGVGNDERALAGGEHAIGDVDGDALLAFRLKAVHQQGQVEVVALGAVPLAVGLHLRELVLEDQPGFVEQAADQRRLAVVHAAAGDEAQDVAVFAGVLIGAELAALRGRVRGHQK